MTEPCAATSKAPNSTITIRIGASHSFLRTRRNTQSSIIIFIIFIMFSELILKRVTSWAEGLAVNPVGVDIHFL